MSVADFSSAPVAAMRSRIRCMSAKVPSGILSETSSNRLVIARSCDWDKPKRCAHRLELIHRQLAGSAHVDRAK